MDCIKYHEIITVYIDEEASPVQSEALEKHLDACSDCRTYLSSQLRLRDMIRDSYPQSFEIDLSVSIMSKISPVEVKKGSGNVRRISVYVAAAAAACVIAISAFMTLHVDDTPVVAGNEKLEEYVIEHVGAMSSDFNGRIEAVNLQQ